MTQEKLDAELASGDWSTPCICVIGPPYGAAKYCVVAESTIVSNYTESMTSAVCYLIAVIYIMDYAYPDSKVKRAKMHYVYEFIQKSLLQLQPSSISPRVMTLQNMIHINKAK